MKRVRRLLTLKRRFNKGLRKAITACVVASVFFIGFVMAFDSDTLMILSLVGNNTIISKGGASTWNIKSDTGHGSGSSSGTTQSGSGIASVSHGVNLMLINSMAEGFCKDFLIIARDHANFSQMQIPKIELKDGADFPITAITGASIAESTSHHGGIPYTTLSFDNYNKDPQGRATLYQYNTKAYKELGSSYHGYAMSDGKSRFRTQLQLTQSWAAISPMPGESRAKGEHLPSKMNGYGVPSGTVRDRTGTDMAYFPDQVAMLIQSVVRLNDNADLKTLDGQSLAGLLYMTHNGGPGLVSNTLSVGGRAGKDYDWSPRNPKFGVGTDWHPKNTLTKKQVTSSAINKLSSILPALSRDTVNRAKKAKFNMDLDPHYFEGATLIYLLNEPDIFINSVHSNRVSGRLYGSGLQGALNAYQDVFGEKTTKDGIISWVKSKVKEVDTSFYGPAATGKNYGKGSGEIVLYNIDDSVQVYNASGEGPRPALHAFTMEATRGFYCAAVSGNLSFYRMLVYSGVDATYEEAMMMAQKPNDIPIRGGNSGVVSNSGAYWDGGRKVGPVAADGKHRTPKNTIGKRSVSGGSTFHMGEDYGSNYCNMPRGSGLIAIADGVVTEVKYSRKSPQSTFGNTVLITVKENVNGVDQTWSYRYAHMNKASHLKVGDVVKQGDPVGVVGSSSKGRDDEYASHLHFEMVKVQNSRTTCYIGYYGVVKGYYTIEQAPYCNHLNRSPDGNICYTWMGDSLGVLPMVADDPNSSGINKFRSNK